MKKKSLVSLYVASKLTEVKLDIEVRKLARMSGVRVVKEAKREKLFEAARTPTPRRKPAMELEDYLATRMVPPEVAL